MVLSTQDVVVLQAAVRPGDLTAATTICDQLAKSHKCGTAERDRPFVSASRDVCHCPPAGKSRSSQPDMAILPEHSMSNNEVELQRNLSKHDLRRRHHQMDRPPPQATTEQQTNQPAVALKNQTPSLPFGLS